MADIVAAVKNPAVWTSVDGNAVIRHDLIDIVEMILLRCCNEFQARFVFLRSIILHPWLPQSRPLTSGHSIMGVVHGTISVIGEVKGEPVREVVLEEGSS